MSCYKNFLITAALCALLSLPACQMPPMESRPDIAEQIAAPAHLIRQTLPAPPFALTVYTRIGQPGQPATLYIEGDGQAWLDRSTPSMDPTPTDPIALRLAAEDPAANVIYLARPCQYTKMSDGAQACPQKYWTDARLAPEVIASLNAALDSLKAENHLAGFHLVGFSGGGGAAVLLAARRNDILSVRTVAGNLNHALFSDIHHIDPMAGSMEPREAAPSIAALPQIHFAGQDDTVIPPAIAESFLRAAGNPPCTQIRAVPGAAHNDSWAAFWPDLLRMPLPCGGQK